MADCPHFMNFWSLLRNESNSSMEDESPSDDSTVTSAGSNGTESPGTLSAAGFHLTAAILLFIALIGGASNLTVIILLGRNKQLLTPMNIILMNLSISDFCISIFGSLTSFVAAIYQRWIYGEILCQVHGFFMTLTGMTAIGTVTAVSVERYLLITTPCRSAILTIQRSIGVIASIWVYALLMAIPPIFGWSHYVIETPGIACSIDWETASIVNATYITYLFAFGYVGPIIIILYSYIMLIKSIKNCPKMSGKSKASQSEQKVTWMVTLMIFCTMFAWTPYAVTALMASFGYGHLIGPVAAVCPALFAKTSVIYNPFVYFLLNPQIRTAFMKTLGIGLPLESEIASVNTNQGSNTAYTLGEDTLKMVKMSEGISTISGNQV